MNKQSNNNSNNKDQISPENYSILTRSRDISKQKNDQNKQNNAQEESNVIFQQIGNVINKNKNKQQIQQRDNIEQSPTIQLQNSIQTSKNFSFGATEDKGPQNYLANSQTNFQQLMNLNNQASLADSKYFLQNKEDLIYDKFNLSGYDNNFSQNLGLVGQSQLSFDFIPYMQDSQDNINLKNSIFNMNLNLSQSQQQFLNYQKEQQQQLIVYQQKQRQIREQKAILEFQKQQTDFLHKQQQERKKQEFMEQQQIRELKLQQELEQQEFQSKSKQFKSQSQSNMQSQQLDYSLMKNNNQEGDSANEQNIQQNKNNKQQQNSEAIQQDSILSIGDVINRARKRSEKLAALNRFNNPNHKLAPNQEKIEEEQGYDNIKNIQMDDQQQQLKQFSANKDFYMDQQVKMENSIKRQRRSSNNSQTSLKKKKLSKSFSQDEEGYVQKLQNKLIKQNKMQDDQDKLCGKRRNQKIWTQDEDFLLRYFHTKFKGKWDQIAEQIPGRNASQSLQRFRKFNNQKSARSHWTHEEDMSVLDMINKYGKNWGLIASNLKGRTGKQVRERYINCLDPDINWNTFTVEEDNIIINFVEENGAKWSLISKLLPGRPENMLKNRYYAHLKRLQDDQTKDNSGEKKTKKSQKMYQKKDDKNQKLLQQFDQDQSVYSYEKEQSQIEEDGEEQESQPKNQNRYQTRKNSKCQQ